MLKFTKREIIIILIALNLLVPSVLIAIDRQIEYNKLKADVQEVDNARKVYNERIEELESLILGLKIQSSYYDSISNNLAQNERFLQTASLQDIINRYDQNATLGGNE